MGRRVVSEIIPNFGDEVTCYIKSNIIKRKSLKIRPKNQSHLDETYKCF